MKTRFLSLMIFLFPMSLYSQDDEGKRIEYRFNERVAFYSVDSRYNLLKDTIFHTNDGFRVFSGYDVYKDSLGNQFMIFKYPEWGKKHQRYSKDPNDNQVTRQGEIKQPVHVNLNRNGLALAMPDTVFKKLVETDKVEDVYSLKCKYALKIASGIMTVPFKLRPKEDTVNFNITTDVTLGAFIGAKYRISRTGHYFLVAPITLGLSYINVADNKTSNVNTENSSSIIPGWTWSAGLVFDLNGVNVGFVLGCDYASGVGDDWLYNKKLWYSFAIGYSFLNKN